MMFTEKNVSLFLIIAKCLLMIYCEPSCVGKTLLRSGDISCEEKQIILDEHNRLRQLVALGQIRGQPGAANMMEMIWDKELAAIAQRWANRCTESYDYLSISKFAIGQNILLFRFKLPKRYDNKPDWKSSIYDWFNEVQDYHFSNSTIPDTGHYTQLVWGNTSRLGCGYSFYDDPAYGYTKNYVCNYSLRGNVIDELPYQPGRRACDNYGLSYSNKYAGLCY